MIKLRDLEYLTAIAEHKHFGKAAKACFVSQPTLSGQLMKLEELLGLTLVERETRSVMLTPAGDQLLEQARQVLQAADDFETAAKALLDPLAGDLHIGLIPTLAPYLLPHIMADLSENLPKVNFFLHENKTQNLLAELKEGKLDVLILPWLEEMSSFERYDLFAEPLVLATSPKHSLANAKQLSFDELKAFEVLTLEDGHCLREQAMGYCFMAGVKEDQSFRATSLETLRYMVASNRGITLLPKLATLNLANSALINYISFTKPQPVRQISLVVRSGYSRLACVREVVKSIKGSIELIDL